MVKAAEAKGKKRNCEASEARSVASFYGKTSDRSDSSFRGYSICREFPNGDFVESGLVTLVMIASLIAVGRDRRVLISAAAFFVPAIAGKWLHHFFPNHVSALYFPVFGIAFFAFTIYRILRFILETTHVDTEVLSAGIVVYLMLGLLWAQAYILTAQITPNTFHFPLAERSAGRMGGFNAFYFSFSTLTTVGIGDITPLSKVARTLAVMEAVTGTLYPGDPHIPACRHVSPTTRRTSRKIPISHEMESSKVSRVTPSATCRQDRRRRFRPSALYSLMAGSPRLVYG